MVVERGDGVESSGGEHAEVNTSMSMKGKRLNRSVTELNKGGKYERMNEWLGLHDWFNVRNECMTECKH